MINNTAITDLPLFANGGLRSNMAFTALAPGVNMNLTGDPDSTTANIRIAGGLGNGASQLLDGSESMSERKNDPQMRVVSAEGIEEFKVQIERLLCGVWPRLERHSELHHQIRHERLSWLCCSRSSAIRL